MKKKPSSKKILFIYLQKSTFVEADFDLLKKHYEVFEFAFFTPNFKNWKIPFRWISQFFWMIKNAFQADVIFGWFVDYHLFVPAFIAKLTGKPLVAVLGGTDTVNIPQWKHGVFASSWRAPIVRFIYKRCTLLFPVSQTLIESENKYTFGSLHKFGLLTEIAPPKSCDIVPIPTGYDPTFWKKSDKLRENIVTTTAFIDAEKRVWIKGIDVFVEAAKLLPEVTFQIVGISDGYQEKFRQKYEIPDNVRLIGPKSTKELVEVYNQSKVYAQFSRLEGFPNVVCEAMLCGCVPVGSEVFGITEILDGVGFSVSTHNPVHIAEIIRDALAAYDTGLGQKCRESIIDRFTSEIREQKVKAALEEPL